MDSSTEHQLSAWLAANPTLIPLPTDMSSRQFVGDLEDFSTWTQRCVLSLSQTKRFRVLAIGNALCSGVSLYFGFPYIAALNLLLALLLGAILFNLRRYRDQARLGVIILHYLSKAASGRMQGFEFLYSATQMWRGVLNTMPDPAFPHNKKWKN